MAMEHLKPNLSGAFFKTFYSELEIWHEGWKSEYRVAFWSARYNENRKFYSYQVVHIAVD